jgi:hypothetical protein
LACKEEIMQLRMGNAGIYKNKKASIAGFS